MLVRCEDCRRHFDAIERRACPFCVGGPRLGKGARIAAALLALGAGCAEPAATVVAPPDTEAAAEVAPLVPNEAAPPAPPTPAARAVEAEVPSERSAAAEVAHAEARKRRPTYGGNIATPLQPYGIAPMPREREPQPLYGLPF